MPQIKFYKHDPIPLEMHKVKIVQQLTLLPVCERLERIRAAGFNTFQLHNADVFLDMLTDSGVNAMSDQMQSAMLRPDDAYAGSETFFRMNAKLTELFGMKHLLPAHQGRACENILAMRFVKPGNCVIMNYHFTTAKAHITRLGGRVEELVKAEGLAPRSDLPFKGDIDLEALEACIRKETPANVPFFRLEAGTNLIGGQPVSFANMKAATDICRKYGIPYQTYSGEELKGVQGNFSPSVFVASVTGVDNVCERAAVRAAGQGTLIQNKYAGDGVTIALAVKKWSVRFE